MRPNNDSNSGLFQKILRMTIAVGYILLAIFVIYKKWLMVSLSDLGAYSLGALLLIYGGYRFYRSNQI